MSAFKLYNINENRNFRFSLLIHINEKTIPDKGQAIWYKNRGYVRKSRNISRTHFVLVIFTYNNFILSDPFYPASSFCHRDIFITFSKFAIYSSVLK